MNNKTNKKKGEFEVFYVKPPKFLQEIKKEKTDPEAGETKNFRVNTLQRQEPRNLSKAKVLAVKSEFVREALSTNPVYRSSLPDNYKKGKMGFHTLYQTNLNGLSGNSQKTVNNNVKELENQLSNAIASTTTRRNAGVSNLDSEVIVDLQGTKGLSKYDCWSEDLLPEDWELICRNSDLEHHAKCPIFDNGEYVWIDVKVLEYDSKQKKFKILAMVKGKPFEKYISRLSIYFLKESLEKFRERIEICKVNQQKTEEKMRFINYVESIPPTIVSSLPQSFFQGIHKRVFNQKDIKVDKSRDLMIFSEMLKIISSEYTRGMKMDFVINQMSDPAQKGFFEDKKIVYKTKPIERIEYTNLQVANVKGSFKDKFKSLKNKVLFKNKKIEDVMRLFQDKSFEFKQTILYDFKGLDKKFPFNLKDFASLQKDYFERARESLRIQWREYLLGDITDIIRKIPIFNQALSEVSDNKMAGRVILEKLLKRIDLIFRNNLKELFQINIQCLYDFIKRFTVPDYVDDTEDDYSDDFWTVSDKPLFNINLKYKDIDGKDKEKKDRKTKEDNYIFLDPSPKHFHEAFNQLASNIYNFIISIDCLEGDITRTFGTQVFKLVKEDKIYFENEYSKILNVIKKGLQEPEEVISQFKQFSYLLEKSKEEIVKDIFDKIKEKGSLTELNEYINKLVSDINQIDMLFSNEHRGIFFKIRTVDLKTYLVFKANDIKVALLNFISSRVNRSISEIQDEYKELRSRMTKKPEKEEDLIELTSLLENNERALIELDKRTAETYNFILLMEKHGEKFEDESMISFWLLKVCPLEVKISLNEGRKLAASHEVKFMNSLDEAKQEFENNLINYGQTFEEIKKFNNFGNVSEIAKKSDDLGSRLDNAIQRLADFNRREQLFNINESKYKNLDKLVEEFSPFRQMWETAFIFDSSKEDWMTSPIIKLNYKKILTEIEKYKKTILVLNRKFEEDGYDEASSVCGQIKLAIKDFETRSALLEFLTKECMIKKPNNWKSLFGQIEINANQQNDNMHLLINSGILAKVEIIEDFIVKADKEYNFELKLQKEILEKLKFVKLNLLPVKNTETFMLGSTDELLSMMDDFLNILVMMKQSPYIGSIKRRVEETEKKLMGIQDLLEDWLKCQRTWIYLSPIFSSEDLKKKMPVEKKLFDGVDESWKQIMTSINEDPLIFENFDWEKTKSDFENNNRVLDQIQKSLSDYLESKREEFPRFYFLSDEELIEIISKTKDPLCVTKYLPKCFEGIDSITFSDDVETINEFSSSEGELIQLCSKIKINEGDKRGNVEKWLGELETTMKASLKKIAVECAESLSKRTEWILNWPGQLVLAIGSARWTNGVEEAFLQGDLTDFQGKCNFDLSEIVDLVRNELTTLQRINISALIVIEVHSKYVIEELIKKRVSQVTDFEWISQFRYYMSSKGNLETAVLSAKYDYQYEYLGNSPRLVITPLTDRCYRTLMSAYQFFYGGAPEGPAGTGKTETVKDLAKAVAVQCNVFNCTDQINYVAMSKFFKGLSQSGSWCCFDEFNRIEPEVLSVIAEQVRTIQMAVRENKNKFLFEGKTIRLIKSCAINITMNPGYAGRSELPDNLKSLFRACAMMVPDYVLIAEIMLYSSGFQTANALSAKIVGALRLSSEQLSAQKHYDFGMRALKAILVAAANLKKSYNDQNEASLCLKALKDVNIPKFTLYDIPLFNSIISDLFPGVHEIANKDQMLLENIKNSCSMFQVLPQDNFINKAIQLYDTILVRHGLIIVGETYSGKTKCMKVLQEGLRKMGVLVEQYIINPKGITAAQLYGNLDQNTKLWTDGIIPYVMKICEEDADKPEKKWVTFDGPVDAVWIENMNTVLDDNKVLCLTNGQKIKLTQWSTMIFEVEDLFNASPATVSRCGMIFMEPEQLQWQTVLDAFFKFDIISLIGIPADSIHQIMKWTLNAVIPFIKKNLKLPISINFVHICYNSILMLKMILVELLQFQGPDNLQKELEGEASDIALYAIVWGVGGIYDESERNELNLFLLKLIYQEDVKTSYDLEIDDKAWGPKQLLLQIKDCKNLFNMRFDLEKLSWSEWSAKRFEMQREVKLKYDQLIIPTPESTRLSHFLKIILKDFGNIILVGPTGTGKTMGVIKEINECFSQREYGNIVSNFSGRTHVNFVQRQIESKMTTRKGKKGHYGPEDNKNQMVVFIDDVNMPAKEVYGAQPPIELLRMMLDHGFWYDLDTLDPKYLKSMNFAASMGPPSSGRNSVSSRFLRHFFIHFTTPYENKTLSLIFSSILDYQFQGASPKFLPSIVNLRDSIVNGTIELFNKIKIAKELLPTPQKSHYIFSMRDISKVFQTMGNATFRTFKGEEDMIKLWMHECSRVFCDRLVSITDKEAFNQILKTIIKSVFKSEYGRIVKSEPLVFTDFVPMTVFDKDGSSKAITGIYSEVVDKELLKKTLERMMGEYNEYNSNFKLNLVLFTEAFEHVIRIKRIIGTQSGHCLLVGLGGLGRKSLTMLSTHVSGFDLRQYEANSFVMKEWHESIIEILKQAGVENRSIVLLLRDNQIFCEEMLEEISSLLNRGEVPGLFPNEEKMKILEEIGSQTSANPAIVNMTNIEKFDFFLKRCKDNLHLSLCFSPTNENFRQWLRLFPSYINCTTIDWFLEWNNEAFLSVGHALLKKVDLTQNESKAVTSICVDVQQSISSLNKRFYLEMKRRYYVTPSNYFEFLNLFSQLYESKIIENKNNIGRYAKGVEILEESKVSVEKMKIAIIELEPKLKVANEETEKLIEKIDIEKVDATIKRENAEKQEISCNKERFAAQELKDLCKSELDKVEPLLEEASKNLKSIQRAHIDFIKTIKNPLPPIQRLFQALCIVFKVKNIPTIKDPADPYKKKLDWSTPARNVVMAKPDQMLAFMLAIDAEEINKMSSQIIDSLKELQKDPAFDIDSISNVSQAAGKIAGFINTLVEIYEKLQIINPKREALKEAEAKLENAEKSLKLTKDELTEITEKINALEVSFNEAKEKKDTLESEIQRCMKQLVAAEKLVSGLENERTSWSKNINELREQQPYILSNILLSSAIIAYLGIFPITYREESIKKWTQLLAEKGIPLNSQFDIKDVLSNDIVIGNWTNKFKLPNDSYSVDNAIIIFNSLKYSITIDPQTQANRWIKLMEKDRNLVILKPNSKPNDIINGISNAIELGYPVLFENVGEVLPAPLISIMQNNRKRVGKSIQVKFLDRWIELAEGFKVYVTTKLLKPHFSPDICVISTILNFLVTPLGLEDQLLNILVAKEDPNSEKSRINNVKEFFELKKKQKQTEENILMLLTNSTGNILDDMTLIETLQKSKVDSKDAAIRMTDIEAMKKKQLITRNFYKKAAFKASHLFFAVNDLGIIEPMYQFSLEWFIELYQIAIAEEPKVKATRVNDIVRLFTSILFNRISPSLFEKDKILFAFMILLKTLLCEELTTESAIRKLFIGCVRIIPAKQDLPGILSQKQWANFEELEQEFPAFKEITAKLIAHSSIVLELLNSSVPHEIELPKELPFTNFSPIDYLIFIKTLRPDKFSLALQDTISKKLGKEFVDFPAFNLENIYKNSKNSTPIIFILSPGLDPLNDIIKLSIQLGKAKNVDTLSLGQGQESSALSFLELAQAKGRWVVLQNCHLAPRILLLVEKNLEENQHQDFRLWLTSMPSENFPVTMLQNSIKITNEAPRGIRSNMMKNFSQFNLKYFDHPKSKSWQRLIFGLTFFHSLIQERRKYGSLGWNISYEFSQTDYIISSSQLQQILKDFDEIPWQTIKYMIAEANYGGRVTDPQDRRLINVILSMFLNETALTDQYKFNSDLYRFPEEGDITSCINFLKSDFPLNDPPQIFGMHENAQITNGINQTNELMAVMANLLPKTASTGAMSSDEIVQQKSNEILKLITNNFNLEKIQKAFPVCYENSMNTVLVQELLKYNVLTDKIRSSLQQLIKAIDGFVMMSEELEELYVKILNNKVSDYWHKYGYPSVKPLISWIKNLCERIEFMKYWVENGQPKNFWISGFFFTQSFLTGILQNYARKV